MRVELGFCGFLPSTQFLLLYSLFHPWSRTVWELWYTSHICSYNSVNRAVHETSETAGNVACRISAGEAQQNHARDHPYKNIHSVSVNISDFAESNGTAHKSQTFLSKCWHFGENCRKKVIAIFCFPQTFLGDSMRNKSETNRKCCLVKWFLSLATLETTYNWKLATSVSWKCYTLVRGSRNIN